MEVKIIENQKNWESFWENIPFHKSFLQSWQWKEFQESFKRKVWTLAVQEKGETLSQLMCFKVFSKRGSFLVSQHGPAFRENLDKNLKDEVFSLLLEKIKEIAKEEKAIYWRFNPLWQKEEKYLIERKGFVLAPLHPNAYESTLKLSLKPSLEELLSGFRKTTRYLIRKAEKTKQIKVFKGGREDIPLFDKIQKKLALEKKFTPFSLDFILREWDLFNKEGNISFWLVSFEEKIVGGAFVVYWSGQAFYHIAAFDSEYKKYPVSYLLMWEAIKEAKERNCQYFDFWGYKDPFKYPKHPWAGPTLFKLGFAKEPIHYLGTFDFVFSKIKYLPAFLIDYFRKIRKRL